MTITEYIGGKRAYKKHDGAASILATLAECTVAEIEHGRTWYAEANAFSQKVASDNKLRPDIVAAIIARLSPQVAWADNKAAAIEVACGNAGKACTQCYPDNVIRAESLASENSMDAIAREVLPRKGYARPKISAFYRNIVEPDNAHTVTVDTWAARIWANGTDIKSLRISALESVRIAGDYRRAAEGIGMLPQVLQAITWIGAHRISKQHGQRELFDDMPYKI